MAQHDATIICSGQVPSPPTSSRTSTHWCRPSSGRRRTAIPCRGSLREHASSRQRGPHRSTFSAT
eukprot:636054-Pyramimonas_sp.AAC.1